MKTISVVIPVYGQWELVKRNVDALLLHERANIREILVINDCSPEPNPYLFNQDLVQVIDSDKNRGYAGTVNIGLRRAKSEIIVLLDSDACPVAPFISKTIALYTDTTVGCVGFSTIDENEQPNGNFQYEPSILGLIAGQLLEAKFGHFRFWRNRNILPYSCAVSFRKTCLEELDYLDERLFPTLDADLDISMRIHRSKWKLLFTRDIIIKHQGGNSYQINHKRVMLFHESRWKLFQKHNMIYIPSLAKQLIKYRIQAELFVFKTLSRGSKKYDDKVIGREKILNHLSSYTQ